MGWENDPYPSPPKNTPMNDAQGTSPIGEGGRTLAEMLEEQGLEAVVLL